MLQSLKNKAVSGLISRHGTNPFYSKTVRQVTRTTAQYPGRNRKSFDDQWRDDQRSHFVLLTVLTFPNFHQ